MYRNLTTAIFKLAQLAKQRNQFKLMEQTKKSVEQQSKQISKDTKQAIKEFKQQQGLKSEFSAINFGTKRKNTKIKL